MDAESESRTIVIEPAQMAGVWTNEFDVVLGPHEVTLDFIRLDYSVEPPPGILVSRVAMSSKMFREFLDRLELVWQAYSERSLPKEIHGPGEED